MKKWTSVSLVVFLASVAIATGIASSRVFVAVSDPNMCVPMRYDANSVPEALRAVLDPNVVADAWLLPPVPGDLSSWKTTCGKWQRLPARACQEKNMQFEIECVAGTSPASVAYDSATMKWSFSAEVLEGPNVWRFRATTLETESSRASFREYYVPLTGEKADSVSPSLY